jgi:5-hydroxyisourate hydrolase
MSQITTHVLDTALGRPAAGIAVELAVADNGQWRPLGSGTTNEDGRIGDLLASGQVLEAGRYRMRFELEPYLIRTTGQAFYPRADIEFAVAPGGEHYHIPLLLSPFGYSTYRGS